MGPESTLSGHRHPHRLDGGYVGAAVIHPFRSVDKSSARANGRASSLSPAGEQKHSLDRVRICCLQTAYNLSERRAKRLSRRHLDMLIALSPLDGELRQQGHHP